MLSRAYYDRNREAVLAKRRDHLAAFRAANPPGKPGRPRIANRGGEVRGAARAASDGH